MELNARRSSKPHPKTIRNILQPIPSPGLSAGRGGAASSCNVLMTFQYRGDAMGPKAEGGGLVEIDNAGHPIRTGTALDLTQPNTFIRPYGVAAVPALDRAVSTNAAMHYWEGGHADTVQLWQRSASQINCLCPPWGLAGRFSTGFLPSR